jgi:hypothetical protein
MYTVACLGRLREDLITECISGILIFLIFIYKQFLRLGLIVLKRIYLLIFILQEMAVIATSLECQGNHALGRYFLEKGQSFVYFDTKFS